MALVLGIVPPAPTPFSITRNPGQQHRPCRPKQVSLSFTQNLEPRFSTVTVTDASGQRVDGGRPIVSGSTMVRPCASFRHYRVSWRVLSVDTHTTEGAFTFHVGQ